MHVSCILYALFYYSSYIISVCSRAALQEENICDGCRLEWGYLRGMHINWGIPLRGLQFGGVISAG